MQNQPDFRTQIPRAQENYHNLEWHTSEITAGMMFHLADGTITGCNPEAEKILGFTREQMLSRTSLDKLWQTIREDGSPFIAETHPATVAQRTGEPVVGAVMGVYQPNGNLIWIKINAHPLFEVHSPIPWATVATLWDITEQKRTHSTSVQPNLLPQSEPQIQTVLIVEDCVEDIEMYRRYLQTDTDRTYRILSAQTGDAGLEIYQTTQLDVVLLDYRLPDYEALEFIKALHPQSNCPPPPIIVVTGQGNEAIAVKMLKSGVKDYLVKGQFSSHELQCAVERAVNNAQLEKCFQQSVEKERLLNQIYQHTTSCLRESQERLELGVKVAGVGLAKFDYASNTVELSLEAAALFGIPSDQLVIPRERIHATFHPEERAELLEIIEQVLDPLGAGCFARDHRVVWESGEVRWLTVRKQVFFDTLGASGGPLYAILAALDITERKQAELERESLLQLEQVARAKAEQANRIKDEFLAVLSHELRSPLNPILGWAKLLQQHKLDETRTNQGLATIQRNAELQTQLIDDLLDISRIMGGKLTLNAVPVSLMLVISAALEIVQLAADTKNIQLNVIREDSRMVVYGDAGRLQQVFWNLFSNAVKFTDNGGKVDIRLTQVENYIQIQVIDTGKGINPEFLPYVFEHFRQEDSATTRKFGGLGLGLAIARRIIEMHGGTIRVNSAGINQGATFTVKLPLSRVDKDSQTSVSVLMETSTPSFNATSPLTNIRTLIVDDDTDSRNFLAFLLEDSGAIVTVAACGTEALQALERSRFDVLLSDIGMPSMDGYTLIQIIRSKTDQPYSQIPAIALTAYVGEGDRQQAISSGFQYHVAKPINSSGLITLITQLVIK